MSSSFREIASSKPKASRGVRTDKTSKKKYKSDSTTDDASTRAQSNGNSKYSKKSPGKASSSSTSTSDQRSSSDSPTENSSDLVKPKYPGGTESKKRLFLPSLYQMCNNDPDNECISWSKDGKVFWVTNSEVFSRRVLPKYFRHNNYASFVRQLNMYGFQRSTETKGHIEQGAPMVEHFSHEHFIRGQEKGLVNIHRKTSSFMKANQMNKRGSDSKNNSDRLDKLESAMVRQIDTQSQMLKQVVELRNNQVIMQNTLAMLQSNASRRLPSPTLAYEHTNKRSRGPTFESQFGSIQSDIPNNYDTQKVRPIQQYQQQSSQGPDSTAVDSPANFEAVQTLLTLVMPSNRTNSGPPNFQPK